MTMKTPNLRRQNKSAIIKKVKVNPKGQKRRNKRKNEREKGTTQGETEGRRG